MFGECIAARHPDCQTAEIQIRVALINRFNSRGTAVIIRVASVQWRKGASRLKRELRNSAARMAKASHFKQPFDAVRSGNVGTPAWKGRSRLPSPAPHLISDTTLVDKKHLWM